MAVLAHSASGGFALGVSEGVTCITRYANRDQTITASLFSPLGPLFAPPPYCICRLSTFRLEAYKGREVQLLTSLSKRHIKELILTQNHQFKLLKHLPFIRLIS